MVTKDYQGNALRAYRHLKSYNGYSFAGLSEIRRVVTGFEGLSVSDFDVKNATDYYGYMESKRGLLAEEFEYQLLEALGYEPTTPCSMPLSR